MWTRTHSVTVSDIEPAKIWQIWSDIPNRPLWDLDLEWGRINGSFEQGAIFYIKPKGGPRIKMEITECVPNKVFTDCFSVPFARLYGIHQMEKSKDGLRLSTTIKVEGLLGWVLRKLVAEKVAAEVPEQTEKLILLARSK
jgi:hypothetical protein